MGLKSGHLYEFGPFVLDTTQHLLLRQGNPVPLTPKTYDLLLVLVENSGRLLSKDELLKAAWPDSFVEESNLTQQISTVRKAPGEAAGEDRYIVTVPGKGYRFAAAVKEPIVKERTDSAPRRMRILVTAGGLAAIAIGLGYYIPRSQMQGSPRSLAILPFQSLKGNVESDFLGFSLADAVITKLGSVRSLTVRPSSAIEIPSPGSRFPAGRRRVACGHAADREFPARWRRSQNHLPVNRRQDAEHSMEGRIRPEV